LLSQTDLVIDEAGYVVKKAFHGLSRRVLVTSHTNVCFGSLPAGRHRITSTAAIRLKADDRPQFSAIEIWQAAFAHEAVSQLTTKTML